MGRNRKPTALIRGHRTKQELAQRERMEQSWRTGWSVECTDEIKADPVALDVFNRIMPWLDAIGANDELFGAQIRRYCTTSSELSDIWNEIKKLRHEPTADRTVARMERLALKLCRELDEFENEYGMTVISSQNFQPVRKDEPIDLLEAILNS